MRQGGEGQGQREQRLQAGQHERQPHQGERVADPVAQRAYRPEELIGRVPQQAYLVGEGRRLDHREVHQPRADPHQAAIDLGSGAALQAGYQHAFDRVHDGADDERQRIERGERERRGGGRRMAGPGREGVHHELRQPNLRHGQNPAEEGQGEIAGHGGRRGHDDQRGAAPGGRRGLPHPGQTRVSPTTRARGRHTPPSRLGVDASISWYCDACSR